MKRLIAAAAFALSLPIAIAAVIPVPGGASMSGPSTDATREIPSDLLGVYMAASTTCPGLPWQVLAGIGWVESGHARGNADPATGEVIPRIYGPSLDGRPGYALIRDASQPGGFARAVGPMQFLTTTWTTWGRVAPDRPPDAVADPHNAWDAIYAAAAYLCGGQDGLTDVERAILRYNRSDEYLAAVLAKAEEYGLGGPPVVANSAEGHGDAVVGAAMTQLGIPYVWGAESPATGFDCSGLVQWSFAQIGVQLPRTTRELVILGTPVADVRSLRAGDLLFTDSNRGGTVVAYGHVAIYAGGGMQIAAPGTGDVVKLQPVPFDRLRAARRVLAG
jgi:cell wall-associated NlpC family hydrolase